MVVLQKDNAWSHNARWLVWKCCKKKATSTIKYYHQGLSSRISTYTVQVLSSSTIIRRKSICCDAWLDQWSRPRGPGEVPQFRWFMIERPTSAITKHCTASVPYVTLCKASFPPPRLPVFTFYAWDCRLTMSTMVSHWLPPGHPAFTFIKFSNIFIVCLKETKLNFFS